MQYLWCGVVCGRRREGEVGEYTSVCVRADDVILNRPGQNTKVLTTCSYDTVDREIFARKIFIC